MFCISKLKRSQQGLWLCGTSCLDCFQAVKVVPATRYVIEYGGDVTSDALLDGLTKHRRGFRDWRIHRAVCSGEKGARGSLESEKVSGRYFTALCQLFTGPLMWEIAALQMWLIGRRRRRHFAVSWDLLAGAGEEQLVWKVYHSGPSSRWSEGCRKGRRDRQTGSCGKKTPTTCVRF